MTAKNSNLTLAALSAIAIFLLAFLALDIYNIRAQNEETSRLLNLADEAADKKTLVQSIRSLQNSAREDIAAFENIVLTDSSLVSMIESIEEAGRDLGLETEIVSVSQAEEGAASGPQIIRLVIETDGAWKGTALFLGAIESLPNRVGIEEARLSKEVAAWHSRIEIMLYSFN